MNDPFDMPVPGAGGDVPAEPPADAEWGERVLAIDHGERRVGLALYDPDYRFVRGLPTIDRKALSVTLVEALGEVAEEHRIDRLVVGLPLTMEGEEGPAARSVRTFGEELGTALGLPVDAWDERLTTAAAKRALRETGHDDRSMRGKLDQLAAVLLLESYVRFRAGGGGA